MMKPADWMGKMSVWQTPNQLKLLVDECSRVVGGSEVLRKQGYGFWRDAWIATRYSALSSAEQVRLIEADFPDFEIKKAGLKKQYEATEVLDPSRRRDDEKKEDRFKTALGQSSVRLEPSEQWLTPDLAMSALTSASVKKATKKYAGKPGLVIYLNWADYSLSEESAVEIFAQSTAAAGCEFRSVEVLWHQKVFSVWKEGSIVLK